MASGVAAAKVSVAPPSAARWLAGGPGPGPGCRRPRGQETGGACWRPSSPQQTGRAPYELSWGPSVTAAGRGLAGAPRADRGRKGRAEGRREEKAAL